MGEMQMWVAHSGITKYGGAGRAPGLLLIARFLEGVTVLNPNRRIVRISVQGDAVQPRSKHPLSSLAGSVRTRNNRSLSAYQRRHIVPLPNANVRGRQVGCLLTPMRRRILSP